MARAVADFLKTAPAEFLKTAATNHSTKISKF